MLRIFRTRTFCSDKYLGEPTFRRGFLQIYSKVFGRTGFQVLLDRILYSVQVNRKDKLGRALHINCKKVGNRRHIRPIQSFLEDQRDLDHRVLPYRIFDIY